ncbi:MAG: hypothetical protein GXO04_01355 [Aquificae bacterium]|nr:hypothetical protein [Aquificota bacterium]
MRDWYILGGFVLLLLVGVWGYHFLKERREEELKRLSYKVYLFEKGSLPKEQALEELRGTPFFPYVLALSGDHRQVPELLKDKDFKKFYTERVLADEYERENFSEVVRKAEDFRKEDFNFPSVKSLEAFSYEKLGKGDKALGIWSMLAQEFPGTYFGNLATLKLSLLKGER